MSGQLGWKDSALMFECAGESLPAIISAPDTAAAIGVLIVVGGPQYRVGSHRQFVLMARKLAARGVPCMRFDYRGMGDASGAARDFTAVNDDIAAAIGAFLEARPGMQQVVLWGLCDAASALCFYPPDDRRVAGNILINPWVRTDAGQAKIFLKHYYLQRISDPQFWKKLLFGGVNIVGSVRALFSTASAASGKGAADADADEGEAAASLPERMALGMDKRAGLPLALFLSGQDFEAREFEQAAAASPIWKRVLARAVTRHFPEADHTFSGPEDCSDVSEATLGWLVDKGFAQG